MAETTHGTGGLKYDSSKRSWPNEINIFIALVIIVPIFELLGQGVLFAGVGVGVAGGDRLGGGGAGG